MHDAFGRGASMYVCVSEPDKLKTWSRNN